VRLLLSNDDGFEAAGLRALADALEPVSELWVVAPTTEQSAQSHSLTMHKPLRAHPRGPRRWAVTGTPADCIYVALHHLMRDGEPDVVVSGINNGSNLGPDVHYSGTVAAAREACLHGRQAIAVSLHRKHDDPELHWATAAACAARVVRALVHAPLPTGIFLNVNVPNLPAADLRGLKGCRLGERVYDPLVVERLDPRGRPYLWIGGPHLHFGDDPDGDGSSVEAGWTTVTPLSAAITSERDLERIRAWTDA
jgi:5'-nucleotidase